MPLSLVPVLINLVVFSSALKLRGHRSYVPDEPSLTHYSLLENYAGGDDAGDAGDAYHNLKPRELPIHYPGKPDVHPDGTEGLMLKHILRIA